MRPLARITGIAGPISVTANSYAIPDNNNHWQHCLCLCAVNKESGELFISAWSSDTGNGVRPVEASV